MANPFRVPRARNASPLLLCVRVWPAFTSLMWMLWSWAGRSAGSSFRFRGDLAGVVVVVCVV